MLPNRLWNRPTLPESVILLCLGRLPGHGCCLWTGDRKNTGPGVMRPTSVGLAAAPTVSSNNSHLPPCPSFIIYEWIEPNDLKPPFLYSRSEIFKNPFEEDHQLLEAPTWFLGTFASLISSSTEPSFRCSCSIRLPLGNGGFAVSPLIIVLMLTKHGRKHDLLSVWRNWVRWVSQILLQDRK